MSKKIRSGHETEREVPEVRQPEDHQEREAEGLGQNSPVELAIYENPDALVFKGEKERYELEAWICQGCGYTEWYCL